MSMLWFRGVTWIWTHPQTCLYLRATQWPAGPKQRNAMSMVAPLRARAGPDDVLWSCPRSLFYYSEYRSNPSSYLKPTGPSPMLHSFTIQKLKLSEGSEPPWFSPSYLWENPCISLQTRVDLGALLKDFHQFIIVEHKTTPNTLNYQPERQPL